jgi:hypothetical protein
MNIHFLIIDEVVTGKRYTCVFYVFLSVFCKIFRWFQSIHMTELVIMLHMLLYRNPEFTGSILAPPFRADFMGLRFWNSRTTESRFLITYCLAWQKVSFARWKYNKRKFCMAYCSNNSKDLYLWLTTHTYFKYIALEKYTESQPWGIIEMDWREREKNSFSRRPIYARESSWWKY